MGETSEVAIVDRMAGVCVCVLYCTCMCMVHVDVCRHTCMSHIDCYTHTHTALGRTQLPVELYENTTCICVKLCFGCNLPTLRAGSGSGHTNEHIMCKGLYISYKTSSCLYAVPYVSTHYTGWPKLTRSKTNSSKFCIFIMTDKICFLMRYMQN